MKRCLLILLMSIALAVTPFVTLSYAAIGDYDFSSPKDGDVDGKDLAELIASPSPDVAGFAGYFGQTDPVTSRKPNILLIVGDDIGMDVMTNMYPGLIADLAAKYGPSGYNHPNATLINGPDSKPASTPALDQLAQQGMRFSNAWAQPFCSPTRASIITGLFAKKHDVITYADPLNQIHTTFVKMLRDGANYGGVNYSTAAFGKWHLAGSTYTGMKPKEAGFQLFKGSRFAALSSYWTSYEYYYQDDTTADNVWKAGTLTPRTLPGIASTTYAPVVKGADTIEWINARQAADPAKPWFAYLAFNMSHATAGTPMMVVPDKDTLDCHPTDPLQDGPACKEIKGCEGNFGGISIGSCNGEQLMRAMTTSMDTVIGKVLAAVDAIPSDTYVVYISDNGTPMYTTGGVLGPQIGNMYITRAGRGKGTTYESGARVPLAIRGPGIAAGSESGEFVHAADVFSTILVLAGLTPPETVPDYDGGDNVPLDSKSLTPILFGSASTVRDPNMGYILTESQNLMPGGGNALWVGARNATYKLVCTTNTSNCTFYNVVDDPLEEYPITDARRPSSCADYVNGTWQPPDARWHYCQLMAVITGNSIFP